MTETVAGGPGDLLPSVIDPRDAPAIYAVLESLVTTGAPQRRVTVYRVRSEFLDRPPYPLGRLLLASYNKRDDDGVSDFLIWYCCARYGALVPVSERRFGVAEPSLYAAPFDEFSCLANAPWNPNNVNDGWRGIYNAALEALVP